MDFKIIAIDGPTGVGKSTIARQLAEKLGCLYVDTGAMFRCLALCWGKHGCPESDDSLQELGDQTRIVFKHKNVICNGKDVTDEIRTELISSLASKISSFSSIREVMKKQQRTLVEEVRKSESYHFWVFAIQYAERILFQTAHTIVIQCTFHRRKIIHKRLPIASSGVVRSQGIDLQC